MSEPSVPTNQSYLVEMNEIVRVTYRVEAISKEEAVRRCVEDDEVLPAHEVEFVAVHSVHQIYVSM